MPSAQTFDEKQFPSPHIIHRRVFFPLVFRIGSEMLTSLVQHDDLLQITVQTVGTIACKGYFTFASILHFKSLAIISQDGRLNGICHSRHRCGRS